MASQKSFKRIAGILIPSVLTALVCAVDPNAATDGVLATTIGLKLMDAVASNWFANTTIEFAEEMFDGRKQIQHYAPSHLAQAIGRAFTKTFDGLAESFRQSEHYKNLVRQGDQTELDVALTLLNEIGLEAQAIFNDPEKLRAFISQAEQQLQERSLGSDGNDGTPLINVQRVLKSELEQRLGGHKSAVVEFILRQLDDQKVEHLVENFQKELQDPESGTSAWRAWLMLQSQQLQWTTQETHRVVQRVEEKLDEVLKTLPDGSTSAKHTPVPNQIPTNFARDLFVGRTVEIAQIKSLLSTEPRLCIIWGMPGIGKSLLASRVATELKPQFADGVLWATLQDAPHLTLEETLLPVLDKFARAYGVQLEAQPTFDVRLDRVHEILRSKQILIVLENIQSAIIVERLLPANHTCALLITTTNRQISPQSDLVVEVKPLPEQDAVTLLQKSVGSRRLKKTDAKRLSELVEGHPTALQILSRILSSARHLEADDYTIFLAEQTNLLTYLKKHEATLDATFELAYRQLDVQQQKLFTQLGLFALGDFSVGALATLRQQAVIEVQAAMGQLATQALVAEYAIDLKKEQWTVPSTLAKGMRTNLLKRYRMPVLFVDFARTKTPTTENGDGDYEKLADYYIELSAHFKTTGFLLLDIEWANLQRIIDWCLTQRPALALTLVNNLTTPYLGKLGFLDVRGYWTSARTLIDRLRLAPFLQEKSAEQAWLTVKAGIFTLRTGLVAEGETVLAAGCRLAETVERQEAVALCLAYAYAALAQAQEPSDLNAARRGLNKAVTLLAGLPALTNALQQERGWLLFRQATVLARLQEYTLAQAGFEQALVLLPVEPNSARAGCHNNLGHLADDPATAADHFHLAKTLAEKLGDRHLIAGILQNLAGVAEAQNDFARAERFYKAAGKEYDRLVDHRNQCILLSNVGHFAVQQQKSAAATAYLSAATAIANQYYSNDPEIQLHLMLNQARLALLDKRLHDMKEWLDKVYHHPAFEQPGFEEVHDEHQQLQATVEQLVT